MPHSSGDCRDTNKAISVYMRARLRLRTRRLSLWMRLPSIWRLRPAFAIVALILALGALSASAMPGTARTHTTLASAGNTMSHGKHVRIGRADLHVDDLPGDEEREVNLSISQTQSDCQTNLRGQLCLRYNILVEDEPVEAGYGLIPLSAVTVTANTITLRVDTRHAPHITRTAGGGGLISITWSVSSGLRQPSGATAALSATTVQVSIVGYSIPSANVTAGVLLYPGT